MFEISQLIATIPIIYFIVQISSLSNINFSTPILRNKLHRTFLAFLFVFLTYVIIQHVSFALTKPLYSFQSTSVLILLTCLLCEKMRCDRTKLTHWQNFFYTTLWGIALVLVSIFGNTSLMQNYWHSANNDIFDGLCGGETLRRLEGNLSSIGENSNSLLLDVSPFSYSWRCSSDPDLFLMKPSAGQYSLLSFFSQFLQSESSMYIFLLCTLIFFALSIAFMYALARNHFDFSWGKSFAIALSTVFSHLYFVTWINGHLGTLIIMPVLILLLMAAISFLENKSLWFLNKSFKVEYLIIFSLCALFILFSYGHVIPILALLIALMVLIWTSRPASNDNFEVNHRKILRRWLEILIVSSAFFFASIIYFYESQFRSQYSFRSWGSFLTPLGLLQYQGIFPGNITSSYSLYQVQEALQRIGVNTNFKITLLAVGCVLPLILLLSYGVKKAIHRHTFSQFPHQRNSRWNFVLVSLIFQVVVFLSLLVAAKDSYYVYKFLYLFQFMIILSVAITLEALVSRFRSQIIVNFCLIATLTLNLFWNMKSVDELQKKFLAWEDLRAQVEAVKEEALVSAISLIGESQEEFILNYLLTSRTERLDSGVSRPQSGIDVVREKGVMRVPVELTFMKLEETAVRWRPEGIWAPESLLGGEFRWVSGQPVELLRSNKWRYFSLDIPKPIGTLTELQYCFQLAEWLDISQVKVWWRASDTLQRLTPDSNLYKFGRFDVTKKSECQIFPLTAGTRTLDFFFMETAPAPSFFDSRRLLFRINIYNGES